jgi:site-specific recombinase XerD
MARNEAFGHKLPLSPSDYERMTALLALNLSPRGLRNAALLAVWYDSLLRVEDCCGLSVGLVAGKSSFRVVQGKVSIASALTGKRRKRGVVCYLQPRTVELVNRYLATVPNKSPDDPLFSGTGRNSWITYRRQSTKGIAYTVQVGIASEQVRQMFKGWCKSIGLDPALYSTQSIRRARITGMFVRGERIKSVMLLAGHADARSTFAYDTPTEEELRKASLAV